MGKPLLTVVVVFVAGLGVAAPEAQAQRAARPLADASLEELMGIRVSSVGRKEQKLTETAAAVYVVTHDDIARSGATSIPEALRMVPGLQVARIDSSKWAITSRGFNGHFANKMLVLIDGRSIYTNLYSGVFWEQYDVMLEDVERIEVVRGPGATMWGANAVNGVINVITRKAKQTQGTMLVAGTGNEDRANTAVRHGGRVGDRVHYRSFAKFFDRGPMLHPSGYGAGDAWRQARGGGRVDVDLSERDAAVFMGDLYRGEAGSTVYSNYLRPDPRTLRQDTVGFSGGFGLGRWTRTFSERSEMSVQAYLNQESRREGFGSGTFRVMDVDFQMRRALGERHDLLWGAGYRMTQDRMEFSGTGPRFDPAARCVNMWSSFVQDDITLVRERLVLTAGSKFLQNDLSGFEVQPTARILWTPDKANGLWLAVSRAVRTPSRLNHDLRVPFDGGIQNGLPVVGELRGSRDFQSESVRSWEAGYRRQLGRAIAVDVAAFRSYYGNLSGYSVEEPVFSLTPSPRIFVPLRMANTSSARSHGVEVAGHWTPVQRWKLQSNYTWLRVFHSDRSPGFLGGGDLGGASPRHSVQLHSALDVLKRLSWDTHLYHVGRLPSLGVGAYARLDTAMQVKLGERYSIAVGGRNLLDPRHTEFVPEDFVRPSDIKRSYYLQLVRRF